MTAIRKDDTVVAVAGKNSGRIGKVLAVTSDSDRVLVEGVNLVQKTLKRNQSQENPQGGVYEKEASLHVSNVMLYCSKCEKGVKVRRERDGKKVTRLCKSCGHAFE